MLSGILYISLNQCGVVVVVVVGSKAELKQRSIDVPRLGGDNSVRSRWTAFRNIPHQLCICSLGADRKSLWMSDPL